jgi:hypothetical protein
VVIIAAVVGGIFSMTPALAKTAIIHFPDGNPDNPQVLCIGDPAYRAHHAEHRGDDLLGSC